MTKREKFYGLLSLTVLVVSMTGLFYAMSKPFLYLSGLGASVLLVVAWLAFIEQGGCLRECCLEED